LLEKPVETLQLSWTEIQALLLEGLRDMILFSPLQLHYGVESEEIVYCDGYKRWQARKISGMWIIYNRRLQQVSYHSFCFLRFGGMGSRTWCAGVQV
jgi:hypothetical protein